MPDLTKNTNADSLMQSLGMTRINNAWKWNKSPVTFGSAGRLPLPLPKSVGELLGNKAADAAATKIALAEKLRQDKQAALDKDIESPGPFSPSYEEASLVPPVATPVGGLNEDPVTRLGSTWREQLWPGVEQILARNLRVTAFSAAWADVLPLFQAQYAEYLVNPVIVSNDQTGALVETTALQISPRSVSGRIPELDATDLAFTPEELLLARQLPPRFLEYHLEAAASLFEKARHFQTERENKAALAASFALDTVQFLVDDQRQRTDIASGVTVAPVIGAMGEWSRSERESTAMTNQSALLESIAISLLVRPSEPAVAAAHLAYATAWMQTVNYGPEIATLSNGTRTRSAEIMDAAQAAAQVSGNQQGLLLRAQSEDLSARATGALHQALSERERAAAAAHSANRAILRVNDLARITTSKLLMACTPGGALNYAQHEQRIRLEYLATLRSGLLRFAACAQGLYSILGYNVKMPRLLWSALPTNAIPSAMLEPGNMDEAALPDEVLLSASLWLRDAATWFLSRMRLERKWLHVVRLRQWVPNDEVWSAAMISGQLSFELDAGKLGSGASPRLRGLALEVLTSSKIPEQQTSSYFTARLSFPLTAGPATAIQLDDRVIGRIRRVDANLMPPPPELTDCILNISPVGMWTIKLEPTADLEDVYLHLWMTEA
ncbi:hypothetical protein [Undibacterium terreum]|uniref:Uncharacterized protein n=1 Tax=Undibacterium terreum TaxID=1224302 RepID=A0A916URF6_9BURK|nr:hypothetical protein [Undibacterium terreum]GGC84716.1 hypothetical protein GCM10011396_35050 [Undibacterium terreum]